MPHHLGSDSLSVFVREAGQAPFAWGASDCFTRMADWFVRLGAADAAAGFRGAYHDALGAARILSAEGGMTRFVDTRMRAIGAKRVETAERGDAVLVRVVEGGEAFEGLTCALALKGSTVSWMEAGGEPLVRTFAAAPVVAAWRFG